MLKYKNVAVLKGGVSNEREISLISGGAIADALRRSGYNVFEIDLTTERLESLPLECEAVFMALHGGSGENGEIQSDLERMKIPYTGAGPTASRIAMDKILSKQIFDKTGILNPKYEVLSSSQSSTSLSIPLVVKPPRDGSSVGLTCVLEGTDEDVAKAIEVSRAVDPEVLIEEYIPGLEWTVAVIGNETLPVIQINPATGIYDYAAKYTSGTTQYTFPEESELTQKCQQIALKACEAVNTGGFCRVDFRISPDNQCYILEINTLPGFTSTSLVPKAAKQNGISFEDLCSKILNLASCGKE